MSFHVPGEELDFTIYGDSNTNQLQLSPTQLHHLQNQKMNLQEGPDLTGYQSGIFDNTQTGRRKALRDGKARSSIVFADQQLPSRASYYRADVEPSSPRYESDPTSSSRRSSRRQGRHGSSPMRIDTTLIAKQSSPPEAIAHVSSYAQSSSEVAQEEHEYDQGLEQPWHEHERLMQQQHHRSLANSIPTTTHSSPAPNVVIDQDDDDDNRDNPADRHSSLRLPSASNLHDHSAAKSSEDTVQSLVIENSPLEVAPTATALRLPVARTATIISTTSSSGRPRLTHRLSYLAHVQDIDAQDEDEDEDEEEEVKTPCAQTPVATLPPLPAPKQPCNSPLKEVALPTPYSSSRSQGAKHHSKPSSRQSPAVAPAPAIPNLYRRLLRVFKPPSESSDSDGAGHAAAGPSSAASPYARGPFGLPASPESSIQAPVRTKKPSASRPSAPVQANPPAAAKAVSQAHKPPEPTGFRARFLRKLMSSPNLNTVVSPATPPVPPVPPVPPLPPPTAASKRHEDHSRRESRRQHKDVRHDSDNDEEPSSPHSDFEHEHSCPVGKRNLERAHGVRPRAATLPRQAVPPTLQSKYGIPGRELGAGTQAQVMLLRVKSTKRARASYPFSTKPKDIPAIATQQQHRNKEKQPASSSHAPEKAPARQVPGDNLLTPWSRSGTLMTTTEDDVTPEQREAYRKRLLRRVSTGGASIMSNVSGVSCTGGLIYAIKKFRPPKATETHRQYLKKVCAEFCISTSMDHENIIRTIDLVRDQPGQDPLEEDVIAQEQTHGSSQGHHHQHHHHHLFHRHPHVHQKEKDDHRNDEDEGALEDDHDCNCQRDHRRVRAVKSAGQLRSSSQGGSSSSSSSSHHHRSAARRANGSKPHRKRSMDSIHKSSAGTPERPSSPPIRQEEHDQRHKHSIFRPHLHHPHLPQGRHSQDKSHHFHLYNHHIQQQHAIAEAQLAAAAKKKKQQREQELRQKEVQRLKQQKEREKQRSKQFRLDQFPEYCMVMEFAAGGDLFNLLTKSHPPISLHEKHCLWRQLVSGVQYMHSMGVAHRDLKPENILIDGSGRILKLTDFGIANVFKSVGDPSPLPCKGIIGSEPYIAPEEFYLDEYDPRAVDVWACGIIFYVMYYAAMPWARADRRKDARYARYISDITTHRHHETQRRLQFERRVLQNATAKGSKVTLGSQGSSTALVDPFGRPHEASHHRTFPPRSPNSCAAASVESSQSGSPTSLQSHDGTESSHTSLESSPVTPIKALPFEASQELMIANSTNTTVGTDGTTCSGASTPVPETVYNTFPYNGHIGGHEFIDRIETPGCRRILYAILEPDVRKRVTIEQVVKDDWVARIRYCTDSVSKQEQQAVMVFGQGANPAKYMQGARPGTLHHQHAVPKAVRN
ncbi:serine/threonine-protein kinase HAL4/sat4 [Mortierella alpina]|nr:serine/threonine-protein kinase HAL4/sat4 [Mortierella alpina]